MTDTHPGTLSCPDPGGCLQGTRERAPDAVKEGLAVRKTWLKLLLCPRHPGRDSG